MMLRARLALIVVVAATALGAGQTPPAQPPAQQTPTFKLAVDYVEVDALVTDAQGNFVRDLTKEDFQVMEDGKPQTISTFAVVDIPIEHAQRPLGSPAPIEPDVRTNAKPFDGRVYVLVLDDLHTAALRTNRVKKAARQFIEQHLGANDLMAVVHTGGRSDAGQEFTSNKRLLLTAVDKTMGQKVESATLNKTREYYNTRDIRQPGDPLNDPQDAERAYQARSTLDSLKSIAEWFQSVRGRRKSILFFSEGIDYDIYDIIPQTGSNHLDASTVIDATRDAVTAAQRSNVSIFGIDPRGLTNLGDDDITVGAYPDDPTVGVGSTSLQNELRLSQDSLRVLSDETGGFATVNRNQFGTSYDRIVQDNSSYYVLAYYPPSDKRDGRFHKIDVRVSRPGLTVRARRGYLSPKGKAPAATTDNGAKGGPSAEVRDALNSPLPISGLTLHVFAAPFKGAAPNASVLLGAEMLGRDLKLGPNEKVELTYYAIDAQGKVRGGNTDTLTLNLKPETQARIEQTGFRLLNRLELPPGRYQLRVASRDAGGGAIGSIIYDLEVPDFYKAPLSMSGLVISSAAGSKLPTARPDEQLKQVLPGPPVGLREFPETDEIAVFAEVYDNQTSAPHKVDIVTTVTSDDAKVVFKNEQERASSELEGKRGGFGHSERISLKDFVPGKYVLKVEARSRLGKDVVASREVQFTIVPQSTAQRGEPR